MLRKAHVISVLLIVAFSTTFAPSRYVLADDVMTPAIDIKKSLELLNSKDSLVAAKAVVNLGRSKNSSKPVIEALIQRLGDERMAINEPLLCAPTPTVGDRALDALVRIDSEEAIMPICEFLEKAKSKDTKGRVLRLLWSLGPTAHQSVSQLAKHTRSKYWENRYYSVGAIGAVSKDPEQALPLLRLALQDKNTDVKSIAVRALGNLGPKAANAVPDLIPLLRNGKSRIVMYLPDVGSCIPLYMDVIETLGKIGPSAAAAIPKLTAILKRNDSEVRIKTALALCQISAKRKPGLDLLLKELEKTDSDTASPALAAEALGQIKPSNLAGPALEGLVKALTRPENDVRAAAIEAIGELSPPDVVQLVLPFAKDDSFIVRASAMRALSRHTDTNPELLDVFVRCIENRPEDDDEDDVNGWHNRDRREAAIALGKMGPRAERAAFCLQHCTEWHEDILVQMEAEKALDQILNVEETIRRLLKQLDDEDPAVAGKAAQLLGFSRNSSLPVIEALLKRLDDQRATESFRGAPVTPTVGIRAEQALIQINQEEVVTALGTLLVKSKDDKLRVTVMRTLGKLGETASESFDVLAACMEEKDESIRSYALSAIASISANPSKTIPLFRSVLRDKKASADFKSSAVCGLSALESEAAAAVPDLIPLLDNTQKRYYSISIDMMGQRYLAVDVAEALARINAKSAIPHLTKTLDSKYGEIRVAAADAICRISGEPTIGLDALLKEAESTDEDASPADAIETLGCYGSRFLGERGINAIRGALKHPDVRTRAAAVRAIGGFKQPDVVQLLRPMTNDTSEEVQAEVVEVLSEHSDTNPELVDVFIEMLAHKSQDELFAYGVPSKAALALGKMGAKAEKAIPVLQKYASSEEEDDWELQEAVQKALAMISKAKQRAAKHVGTSPTAN